ncbi:hypothetical protein [Streptomyces sp. NPDC001714]|uniref:hypothetical protein n=1 Tax=Streptomyces sp. NPDC001714 TaxID=3364603 RepID=UPI003699D565
MTEAHSPAKRYDRTALDEMPSIAEREKTAAPDKTDRFTAVAPHLSLLRDSLARDADRDRRRYRYGKTVHGHVAPRRRRPGRTAVAGGLTLAQWISRTATVR